MKVKLDKRSNRLLLAALIGVVFACGSFLLQQTKEPIAYSSVNPASINCEASCDIETVYNGINQVKINGYSAIKGIDSGSTKITIVAVPKGRDIYSGYPLPGSQESTDALSEIFGGEQDYSHSGITANCYVSQIPQGFYNIGILTQTTDGGLAYKLTTKEFENGINEASLDALFLVIAFIVYFLCAYLCLELLFKKKNAAIQNELPENGVPGRHSLLSILNIIFLALFFWIFLNITFANITAYANIETFKALYSVWGAVLVFIAMYSVWHGMDFTKKPSAKTKLFITLGCLAFFLFQFAVCTSLSGLIKTDSNEIANSAFSYIQYGMVTNNPNYFIIYPNNYFMLFTDIGLYKLAGGVELYFQQLSYLVNIACLDGAILLSYLCIKELLGRKPAAVMLLPLCLIIGLNPNMSMFYTDIITMIVPVLIFFLYLKLRKSRKIWLNIVLLVLIALITYLGYQFKMTSIIILIAIAVVELIAHIKQWKRVVCVLLSCALVFGIVWSLSQQTKEYTDTAPLLSIDFDKNPNLETFPISHWVMLGLSYPFGKFNQDDADFSLSQSKETRDIEILAVISQRLAKYGPVGYLAFLNNKADYAFGDGTFAVGSYGDFEYYMPDTMILKLFQDVFSTSGKWYPLFAYTLQGVWVLCLFLIVCPLFFKNRKKFDPDISILRLSVVVILVYLLVSENNPKQLVNQLPLILILAAFSLQTVMNGCKSFAGKGFKQKKKLHIE